MRRAVKRLALLVVTVCIATLTGWVAPAVAGPSPDSVSSEPDVMKPLGATTSDLTVLVKIASGPATTQFHFSGPAGTFQLGDGQAHTFPVAINQLEQVTQASAGWSVAVTCTNGVLQGVLGIPDLTPTDILMAPATPATCTFTNTELPTGAVSPLTGGPDTNLCPPQSHSVLVYASYFDLPVIPGLTGATGPLLDGAVIAGGNSICIQHAPKSTWVGASDSDFAQFDMLWIGADACKGDDVSDFAEAIQSRPIWEGVIDPQSVMVFGGDIDLHIQQAQAAAPDIGKDLVQSLTQSSAPGLLLHVGCYSMRNAHWLDGLGGTFGGLTSTQAAWFAIDANEPNPLHPFNINFNHQNPANWAFNLGCHANIVVDAGKPVERYELQPVAEFHYVSDVTLCVTASVS